MEKQEDVNKCLELAYWLIGGENATFSSEGRQQAAALLAIAEAINNLAIKRENK